MSQIKTKILQMIANTKISGRYKKILELHLLNPNYQKLSYHNVDHVVAVLNLFEVLRKLSGKQFDNELLEAALLAIVFHDIEHSGHPDTHSDETEGDNVSRAIASFINWSTNDDRLRGRVDIVTNTLLLIKATEYPHIEPTTPNPALRELIDMIRDADILWGMLPGNAEQSMIGMWLERKAVGLETDEKLNIATVLPRQIKFIQNYQPFSGPGRTLKNALFNGACEAWALAALEYERQVQAADMIGNMNREELLAFAAHMQELQAIRARAKRPLSSQISAKS